MDPCEPRECAGSAIRSSSSGLAELLARGELTVSVGEWFLLEQGAAALAAVRRGSRGAAIVLRPADPG